MAANLEQLSALERRLQMSVPLESIEREIGERLKKLARNAKMPGFRPGKVPKTRKKSHTLTRTCTLLA